MILPRVFWDVDGDPIGVSDWSASSTRNFGYDQMRGTVSAAQAYALDVRQGSTVTGTTETGVVMWQGRLAAPPKVEQDGTAKIAAQGHGYDAVKDTNRYSLRVQAIFGDWKPAHEAPFYWPTGSASDIAAQYTPTSAWGGRRVVAMNLTQGSPTILGVVMWSPGTRFTRIRGHFQSSTQVRLRIYTADGPNVYQTRRLQFDAGNSNTPRDVTFAVPGDAVILTTERIDGSTLVAGTNYPLLQQATEQIVDGKPTDTSLFGNVPTSTFADHLAREIGRILGWDTSGVKSTFAGCQIDDFDYVGPVAALNAAAQADLCWRVLDDRGSGPYLEFGAYEDTWEVSGRTGSRWSLDPLENYSAVRVQYLRESINTTNYLAFNTWINGTSQLPRTSMVLRELSEERPNLLASGFSNELHISLANAQKDDKYAGFTAWQMLKAAYAQRWRGNIAVGRAFQAGTGRESPFEIRGGDLVRITDHSKSDSLTLRVADVTYTAQGVTLGVEAPSFPTGQLGIASEGGFQGMSALFPGYGTGSGNVAAPAPVDPGGGGGGTSPGSGGYSGPSKPWNPWKF